MSQRVKVQERLLVGLLIAVPDVNRSKSYKDKNRKYQLVVDGIPMATFDQDSPREMKVAVKLRSVLEVKKVYGNKRPDAGFVYRVGENFAEVTDQVGRVKRIALDFTSGNRLEIEDDISFNNLTDIR